MPSFEHELLVAIVREHPEAVLALLRSAYGVEHRGEIEVIASPENLTELQSTERRADAVLVLREPGQSQPRVAIVVEVQLRVDARKRFGWPVYVSVARARLGCPVNLVVIALDAATASWCATPIELDDHGSTLRPRVIGPTQVPPFDVVTTRRYPELGVLSLLAHRDEPIALDLGRALLSVCPELDDERRKLYTDIVFAFANAAARRALEIEMSLENYEVESEFLRDLQARAAAQGQAKGHLGGLASAVLKVIEARGLPLTDDQRATVLACTDPDALEIWLQRAITANRIDELFVP